MHKRFQNGGFSLSYSLLTRMFSSFLVAILTRKAIARENTADSLFSFFIRCFSFHSLKEEKSDI